MKKLAIISAAGVGSRVEQKIPKQFIEFNSKPMFILTLEKFSDFDTIILVIQPNWVDYAKEQLDKYGFDNTYIVLGADTAEKSRINALNYIKSNSICNDNDVVIFHDSVRPNITRSLIDEVFEDAQIYKSAAPVIPCKDSMIDFNKLEILDNKNIYRLQTPMGFIFNDIWRAYELDNPNSNYTGEGSPGLTYFKYFQKLHTITGDEGNFKVTTPDDLKLLKKLYK
jgi:2-C-methyl-D-erythritol 4-phosphate cytidylyltransferase